MKSTHVLAAAGLALCSFVHTAELPPGFSIEAVNMSLPEEGAPKAEPGPHAVTSEAAFGNAGLVLFRPTNLDSFPKQDTLPVVIWGNGGCAMAVGRHAGFLQTIASHGVLVISTAAATAAPGAAPASAAPKSATAEDLAAGITWALAENRRDGSPLKGRIATRQLAIMGQSCGGRLALELGGDPRVATIGAFGAGVPEEEYAALKKLHGPVLLLNGGERDFMMGWSKGTFGAIDKVPVFYGSRHGAGHSSTIYHVGGGEFANVATNWVMWQLKKDREAAGMFVGKKCGLCANENWDVERKRLK